MKMTITEYIKRIGDIRSNYDRWSGLGLTLNEAKTFDIAIEIVRKYQKIKQIIDDWENSGEKDDPINIIDNIEEAIR